MSILSFVAPLLIHLIETEGPPAVAFLVKHLQDNSPGALVMLVDELKKLQGKDFLFPPGR